MAATHGTTDEPELVDRVNQLYWSSGSTVDQIVSDLGIGRSTLYSSVRPQPAGIACEACGEPMMYTNRTSRDQGTATCSACGMQASAGEDTAASEEFAAGSNGRAHDARDGSMGALSRWREDLAAVSPERAAMVGGAAALGIVVGAAAARAIRHWR